MKGFMVPALAVKDLHKTYQSGFTALKGISFEVAQGDFFALLGPNGAGKSTTIGIITSLVNKTSGEVSILGYDTDSQAAQAKRNIGLVPQEFNFNQFEQVSAILMTQAGHYGVSKKHARDRVALYLRKLGLWDKRHSISRTLSGGMKRRLMIARALVHQPKLLILDEPTAGVDIEMRRGMWSFLQEINQQGVTIILTTHYLEEAEQLCRNIAIIDQGVIIKNTSMQALLKQGKQQTFILDINQPLTHAPQLKDFHCTLLDNNRLQVTVNQANDLNQLFSSLSAADIQVTSLRNKANRLEELFVDLVADKGIIQ
jgi:ABC-2 type transport system ATP-binding protein